MMINNNLIAEAKTRIQATSSADIIMVNNETNVNNDNHDYNNDVGGDENVLALDEAVVDVDHNNIKANNNNNTVANQIVASTTSSPLPTQPPPTLSSSSTTSQHLLLSQPTKPNTNANPVSNTKSSSLKTVCGDGGGFSRKNNINHKAHNKKQKNLNVDFNKNNVDKFKRNPILASLSSSFNTNHSIHLGSNDGNSNNETTIDENITLNRRNADDDNNINESNVVPSLNSAPDSTINEMIIHHNNASTNNGNNNNSINDHHLHNPPHQIFNPQLHQKQKNNNNNNNEMIAQVANDPILSAYPNMDLNSETLGITKRTVIIHKDSRGYGMRISGDNPVFIQHVNEEGAAYKAGVRSGDQIIKVNGTLVTKLGHADVVRMIQSCGSFVGLTLLSKPPSSTTSGLGPTSSSSSSALDSNNRSQSHNLNASPADSPTPPTQPPSSTTMIPLIPNVSPTIQPVAFSPIFPIAAAMFPSNNNNNNNPIRITGPQPVPVSTQQQFHENSIKTLKEMIQDEQRHLEELKLMRSSPVEVERCQKRINDMKFKLDMHQNNLSTFTTNNQTTTTTFGAGGSHSRQQSFDDDFRNSTLLSQNNNSCSGMTTPRIMPMDEDIDMDPDNSVYHQQKYEYIDDLEPTPFDSRDIGVISKPITKSVSNPTQPIMLRLSANGQQANNKDKVKRDSKILMAIAEQIASSSTSPPLPPSSIKWWSHLETDSLRICRYFIQKMVPPNQLLFYVMAKTVFPQIFTLSFHNKAQVIKRWAYQLISTFVTKDSPLFMQEFPPDYLERFDQNLNALIVANPSATDVVASPFDPFIISIQEVVRKQREEFVQMTQRQRLTSTPNPKHELQSTIEMLLTTHSHIAQPQQIASPSIGGNNIQAKLDLRDMDSILDIFIQHVKQNQAESTMALISSLLAIGRYIFKLNPSKHCLLLESSGGGNSGTLSSTASNVLPLTNIAVPSSLNPLLKLSDTTSNSKKSNPKRNSMIPIGSRSFSSVSPFLGNSFDSSTSSSASSSLSSTIPNHGTQAMVIEDYSHCFVPIVEMDHIMYCTSCMLPMWGDPYTLKCTKCLMHTHLWCRKHAAANNPCNNDTHHHQHQNSTSSQSGKQSNRRAKSEKKSVLERFTGKRNNKPRSDPSQIVPITSSVSRTSSFSSTTSTDSNSSSEGMDSDAEQINFSSTSNTMAMAKHDEDVESSNTTSVVAETPAMQNPEVPVNRSGSFVQRKKKKSSTSIGSPRKRSDPALTSKQISTISGNGHGGVTGAGTLPQLTSARSSGALMNSASVGAHDSQFRTITGQRAKHLTSSDSSLMSATTVASKMKSAPSSSGMTNMFANNDSNKSSSTNLTSTSSPRRTRHRNTNDSAIQMDGSSDDELNDFEPCNEKSNEESNDGNDVTPPPLPSSSSFSHSPPPLPPRPDSQTEKRRQIQMEIIQTEEEHYEVLRYIRKVYQKPLKTEKLLSDEQMDIIFGNVRKLRRIHRSIFAKLSAASKNQLQSINSDPYMLEKAIHEIFCGDLGKKLETEASKFCVNRKIRNGIELWNSKKKDSRLRALVDSDSRTRSMPDNPLARLGLDDLLSRVFQRPLRYPLLFERLSKSTPKDSPGYRYLEEVLVCCRRSGEKINEATKKAELKARFSEIIRKTDFSSFSNPSLINNLEQHELLHEGPLVWRITKTKLVEVLLILTDQIILVLTRDSSDRNRYSLRSHNNPTQINKVKLGYRPDIKMDDLLMRDVATDHAAFFLVSRSQDIIYEFAATTSNERNKWKEVITKAINEYREKHPSIADLQQQKSFTSTRSMTMMDLKTPQMQSNDDVSPPPLPPPSILNRPLPKPPESSSPPPPPPLPPPSSSFINRPLPKPPIDSEQTQPAPPSSSHQSRYDGSIRVVSANDLRPSSVDLVPFSQVQVSPNYRGVSHLEHSTRTKSNDLREINDNIKNLIQEGRRSGGVHLEDLEREIQEMSMVYDVAKHDADSKETLSRLITDMFRKATEWSYHFVQNDEPAKCELSQRVRNSVESFVKSYIDSNFILPLPDDGDQVDECPDSLFVDDAARANNENIDVVDGAQESLITSMASCQLAAADPVQKNVVRRSFSDKSNKSDKPQETGLDSSHNDDSNNLNENEDQNQIIGNIDVVEDSDVRLIDCSPRKKSSPSPNPFDQASSTPPRSISSSSPISAVQQTSSSKSSNPFLNNNTNPDNESNITTMIHGNLEISSIGMAEFVALSENSDDDDDGGGGGGGGYGNILNETQTNLDNDDILRNSPECGQNDESKSSDNQNDLNFDLNHDQSLDQTVEQSSEMSNLNKDISSMVENDFSKESSSIASPRSSSKKKTKSHTYLI